jgi:hypothetical protein
MTKLRHAKIIPGAPRDEPFSGLPRPVLKKIFRDLFFAAGWNRIICNL